MSASPALSMARRVAVGNALDDDSLDRRPLAPVLLVCLQHQLHSGSHAREAIGSEPHRLASESLLTDLLDVLLGHDPRRARGRGGIEDEEVGPRRVQDEADAIRVNDVHGLDPVVQKVRGGAAIAREADFTSSAVKGSPLWNLSPSRSLNSYTSPSGLSFQDSARHGAMSLPGSGLIRASCRAYRKTNGTPIPGVSAGSRKVRAIETSKAMVSCPSGWDCAAACPLQSPSASNVRRAIDVVRLTAS